MKRFSLDIRDLARTQYRFGTVVYMGEWNLIPPTEMEKHPEQPETNATREYRSPRTVDDPRSHDYDGQLVFTDISPGQLLLPQLRERIRITPLGLGFQRY
jgi:hypothetical protein